MRRCGMLAGLAGVTLWWAAYAVLSIVICIVFALPFVVLFVVDSFFGERPQRVEASPMLPPRQPDAVLLSERRAA